MQTEAAFDANTHLIDGDGGSVGQIHLWSLFTLPQRSKEQRRVQGAILAWRTASAQPAGWKEPVTSKEGQQEDTDVVQREH